MKAAIYPILAPIRSWLYWRIANWRRGTRVEGVGVHPRARIAAGAMVRRGVEMGADVEMGAYSYVSGPGSYVEAARIGRFCSIARRVVIGPGDHDLGAVTTHPFPVSPAYGGLVDKARPQHQKPPPEIGHDVWIGMDSIILRGVTIGNGAVIAAGSVVTRDVPAYMIAGGIPARVLRPRFPAREAEALERIRWWDWSEADLRAHAGAFGDTAGFIRSFDADFGR